MKIPAGKRLYLLLCGAALLIVLLAALTMRGREPVIHTFSELVTLQPGEVRQLVIRDGATGEQLETEEGESIAAFLELLAPLAFQQLKVEAQPGWTHLVDLYWDNDDYLRLVFSGETVEFIFYERGAKMREAKYGLDSAITARLESYFALLLAEREAREREIEEEAPKPPVILSVREIEPAICVVINNYPAARPSSGLQQADIVYEFLVEGGTTRYLAVYKKKHLENFQIGPVRSLRPYFAVQSLEYGGIIAHSGYSARTAQMIAGMGLFQIGDNGKNFWRDRTRQAPHNLYTSIDNLYLASLSRIQPVGREYVLDQEAEWEGGEEGKTITVNYNNNNRVSYRYDETEGVYYRFINDTPHTDRETGEQYYARWVIIRETAHQNVPGPEALVDIDLQGTGNGLIYAGGLQFPITWGCEGRETVFYLAPAQPLQPVPGTWIQVVRR